MLDGSVSAADMGQRGLVATSTATNSLSHPFSFVDLVDTDARGWTNMGGGAWTNDFVPDAVELATFTHAEMATDRFAQQMASVLDAVASGSDPHWAAVTTYYAAFYAAQALLLQVGQGAIKLPTSATRPFSGVLAVSTAPSATALGRRSVELRKVGGSSHRATWQQLTGLIDDLLVTDTAPRTVLVLETLRREVESPAWPAWLSDLRNDLNYDITSSPYAKRFWSSLLFDLDDPGDVEDELARSFQRIPERRFEIVALGCACLSKRLREEHQQRGGRLDQRQRDARRGLLRDQSWLVAA